MVQWPIGWFVVWPIIERILVYYGQFILLYVWPSIHNHNKDIDMFQTISIICYIDHINSWPYQLYVILMCFKPCYGFRDAQMICIPGLKCSPRWTLIDQSSHAIPCIPPDHRFLGPYWKLDWLDIRYTCDKSYYVYIYYIEICVIYI